MSTPTDAAVAPTKKSYKPGNFTLTVKRSKTGLGLFAGSPIPAGACVIEYVGQILYDEEWYGIKNRYLFAIDDRRAIDGSSRANLARYINHSCIPNCQPELYRGRIFLRALRLIEVGEELSYDYGSEYTAEFIAPIGCRCLKCEPA